MTKESGKLGDATDDLNIKKENLTNILNKINPALGGLADGLFNAAELAGELGSKSLNLNGIMAAGRKGIVKYKDALLLLGAGGAAFLAITALVNAWKELVAAEKEAVKIFDEFQKRQGKTKETTTQLRERIATVLNETRGGNFTEADVQEVLRIRRLNVNAGVDPDTAFDIAVGKRAPLTKKQLQAQREFVRTPVDKLKAAQRQALQVSVTGEALGGRATFAGDNAELRAFIASRTDRPVDEVLQELATLSADRQGLFNPNSIQSINRTLNRATGFSEGFGVDTQNIAAQLNIQGQIERQKRLDDKAERSSDALLKAAESIRRAVSTNEESILNMNHATRNMGDTFERRNRNLARNGIMATPRGQSLAGNEGGG